VHMPQLCGYSPGTVDGKASPAWRRQIRVLNRLEDRRSFTDEMRYEPGCLAVPLRAMLSPLLELCPLQTGAAERLLALHLQQRPSEAHHNLDVLPRGHSSLLCRAIGCVSFLCVGGYLD
jgi:hypothetical protein